MYDWSTCTKIKPWLNQTNILQCGKTAHGMMEDFYSANHDAFVTCSVNLNVLLKADVRCSHLISAWNTSFWGVFSILCGPLKRKKPTDGAKAKAKVKVAPKKAVNPDEVETVLKLRDPSWWQWVADVGWVSGLWNLMNATLGTPKW